MGPKVVIIGARRVRQGIGEFVARSFHAAGAVVTGVVGTSHASASEAAEKLASSYGISARPYAGLESALAAERPEIVAICSPYELHFEQLRATAEHGCHCLCEKPFGWLDGNRTRTQQEATAIVDRFIEKGRHLALITQWPETLSGFYQLHPDLRGAPLERFEMLLGPSTIGAPAVLDSLPHVISMLQALAGEGELRGKLHAEYRTADRKSMRLEFDYQPLAAGAPLVRVGVDLRHSPAPPRPAAYAINGRRVEREIELPSYALHLVAEDGRLAPIADPLAVLVTNFLGAVAEGRPVARRDILSGMQILGTLYKVVEYKDR